MTLLTEQPHSPGGDAATVKPPAVGRGFAKGVLALSGGTLLAQAITVLSSPIKLRLFEPQAFGVLAAFNSVIAILVLVGGLSYELAIVIPKRDEDAANLLAFCVSSITVLVTLLVVVVWWTGGTLLAWVGQDVLVPYAWWLCLGIGAAALTAPLRYWMTRRKRFTGLALVRVLVASVIAIGSIGAGVLGWQRGVHLIRAQVAGVLCGAVLLAVWVIRRDRALLAIHVSRAGIGRMVRRYRKFPLVITWSALIGQGSKELPTLLLTGFFGPGVTGLYAMARAVLLLPFNLFGMAISQVFLQRAGASRGDRSAMADLTSGVARRLITVALLPVVVIALAGPPLFAVCFGAKWTQAGMYAAILSMSLAGMFVGGPLGQLFVVMERQITLLLLTISALVARIGMLTLGGLVLHDIVWTLTLFSLVGLLLGLVQLAICMRLTGAKWRPVGRHTLLHILFLLPSAGMIAVARFAAHLSAPYLAATCVVAVVPYVLLVLRHDRQLRDVIYSLLPRRRARTSAS